MHFHPFGIPIDEFIVVALNASNVPLTFYLGLLRKRAATVWSTVRRR